MLNLKDHDRDQLREALAARGVEAYRGDQVFRWVWRRGARAIEEMTDLSKALRERLAAEATLPVLEPTEQRTAPDGTTKLLVGLPDGREVESVLIPDGERRTLCVSTQVGCAMGCAFCRTATMGLLRNLSAWEVCEQVLIAERILLERGDGRTLQLGRGAAGQVQRRLTNLVFMGMGEPLHNLEATVTACRILTDPDGLAFPERRITVSTVGLADRIAPFLERTNVGLAISLNAPDDEVRSRIMPVNRKFDMDELLRVVRELPLAGRRRVTFEYVLLAGENDSTEQARALGRRLRGVAERIKVNLIPYNPHEGAPFQRPSEQRVEAFRELLMAQGVEKVLVRRPRGDRILAACGQLALAKERA
ncbi:MAG: 23S rRNA (adenine(2503)-C(2))-methyltransferase RlmN [Planctomycetota bacterium]